MALEEVPEGAKLSFIPVDTDEVHISMIENIQSLQEMAMVLTNKADLREIRSLAHKVLAGCDAYESGMPAWA